MKQETDLLLTEAQLPPPPPPRRPTAVGNDEYPFPPGLTPRATEILRLVIGGLDNQQISQRLQTSQRNVEKYILYIQTKIDLFSKKSPLSHLLNNRQ